MEVHLRMAAQELIHPSGLVGRQVVENDVDLLILGLAGNKLTQEGHELLTGMAVGRTSYDTSCFGVQRRVERQRAMTEVLEAMPLQATRGKGQNRVQAVKRLDGRLLVDTKHSRMLRWIQVKTNYI